VSFFEEHFFKLYEALQRKKDWYQLYRLIFTIRNSIKCMDMLTLDRYIQLFKQLSDNFKVDIPETITSLSCEILRKFLTSKDLLKKMRVAVYETLPVFNLIASCKVEAYFDLIHKLLSCHIAKEYSKYSGLIMGLITNRFAKEYVACVKGGLHNSPVIVKLLSIVKDFLPAKGVLDEEYGAIEPELGKIFLYLQAREKIEFGSDIYEIAAALVRASGSHLSILDPVVLTFGENFERSLKDLHELYEVFYAYVLKDTTFVTYEQGGESGLSQGITQGLGFSGKAFASHPIHKRSPGGASPFTTINKILLEAIRDYKTKFTIQEKLQNYKMALTLVILEFQVHNEGGMFPLFKDILEEIILVHKLCEESFNATQGSVDPKIYAAYIWTTIAVLNVLHYYYETVLEPLKATTFIQNFVNHGILLIKPLVSKLPKFLSNIYTICCTRLIGVAPQFGIPRESVLLLITAVIESLAPALATEDINELEEEALIGKKLERRKKKDKSLMKGTYAEGLVNPEMNRQEQMTSLSELIRICSDAPQHNSQDFYICNVNLYSYVQRTVKELCQTEPQFPEFVRSNLTNENVSLFNDIMSAVVELRPTNLISSGTSAHEFKEVPAESVIPRKIAKVVRAPGGGVKSLLH
jgi:hypothetical protein